MYYKVQPQDRIIGQWENREFKEQFIHSKAIDFLTRVPRQVNGAKTFSTEN